VGARARKRKGPLRGRGASDIAEDGGDEGLMHSLVDEGLTGRSRARAGKPGSDCP